MVVYVKPPYFILIVYSLLPEYYRFSRALMFVQVSVSVQTDLQHQYLPWLFRVAATVLQQVQGQLKTAELPNVDDSLAALSAAAAGR